MAPALTCRSRRTSHDLVLIFPTWSCMSCYKLLQSHILRHFHYVMGISLVTYLVAVCPLFCCWPTFQSIATDDEKHYLCQNIVLNNKPGPLLLDSLTVCTDGRDIVC